MKRFLKITVLITVSLLLLLIVLGLLLPYIVNLSAIKGRIAQKLSQSLKADVRVETLKIRVFWRPGLSAEGVRIETPRYLLTLKSLRLYPDIRALLHRELVIRDFALLSPDLTVTLPEKPSKKTLKPKEVLQNLPVIPPLEARISEGRVRVERAGAVLVELTDLSLEIATHPEQILVEGKGQASFAQRFYLKSRFNLKEGAAEGLLEVSRVDLSKLKILSQYLPLSLTQTDFSFSLAYTYEDDTFVAGFKGTAPRVRFRKAPELLFSCAGFEGEFSYSPESILLNLRSLDFKEPRISGEIQFSATAKEYTLLAKFKEIDFAALRLRLLKLFPQHKNLKKFLRVVRGGIFSEVEMKSRGPQLQDLFRVENLLFSARVKEGRIRVPKPPLDLSEISGTLSLVLGDLNFRGSAQLPGVSLSKASGKVHLKSRKAPLKISASFSGEAARLFSVATKASPKVGPTLKGWNFKGPVKGKIVLSGSRAKPLISLTLQPQGTLVSHDSFPFPFKLSAGTLTYRQRLLRLSGMNISGKWGNLERVAVELTLTRKPYTIKISELRGKLKFSELKETLLKWESVRSFLEKYRPTVKIIEVKKFLYTGPLEASVLAKKAVVEIMVSSGEIYLPFLGQRLVLHQMPVLYRYPTLSFGPGELGLYEAKLLFSGEIGLEAKTLAARGSGHLDVDLLRLLYQKARLKEEYLLKPPLKLEDFSLQYDGENLQLKVSLFTAGGAKLSFDLRKTPSLLRVSSGKIVFGRHALDFSWEKFPEYHLLKLKGELFPSMLSALLSKNPGLKGYLKGDLKAYFHFKHPLTSRFEGRLEGRDFVLPVKGRPYVHSFKVRGVGRTFYFDELRWDVSGSDFLASGRLEVAPKSFRLEGGLKSRFIDLPELKSLYGNRKPPNGERIKFLGHLGLDLDRVRLNEKHSLEGFKGNLFVYPEKMTLVFSEARWCGLPLNGKLVKAKEKTLDLNVYQPQVSFESLFSCVSTSGETLISGNFILKSEIHLQGERSWFEKGSGSLQMYSRSGTVHRFGLLAKIFAFLSPSDLFKGSLPSLKEKGFPYEKLGLEGKLRGNRFRVTKAFLEGPGIRLFASGNVFLPEGRLDLTVLVSPFKTVDTLTSKIPVVGFLLTGKDKMLISVPLKVKGTYRDPSITPLHPEAIGEGLFGLFKRVFELPGRVIKPK